MPQATSMWRIARTTVFSNSRTRVATSRNGARTELQMACSIGRTTSARTLSAMSTWPTPTIIAYRSSRAQGHTSNNGARLVLEMGSCATPVASPPTLPATSTSLIHITTASRSSPALARISPSGGQSALTTDCLTFLLASRSTSQATPTSQIPSTTASRSSSLRLRSHWFPTSATTKGARCACAYCAHRRTLRAPAHPSCVTISSAGSTRWRRLTATGSPAGTKWVPSLHTATLSTTSSCQP